MTIFTTTISTASNERVTAHVYSVPVVRELPRPQPAPSSTRVW
jgi:hypothetical protein